MIPIKKTDLCEFDTSKNWERSFLKIKDVKKEHSIDGKKLGGSEISVCIIDTGFSRCENTLAGREVTDIDFTRKLTKSIVKKLDNNESGSEIVDYFKCNMPKSPICEDISSSGHGTKVMSILAGSQGIAPECTLFFAKVYDSKLELAPPIPDAIALSIFWSLANDVEVINISSTEKSCSDLLTLAVREAHKRGTIIVCGSGNSNSVTTSEVLLESVEYPGAYQKTLAIGALDSNLKFWGDSDKGRLVDFYAPGVNVTSPINGLPSLTGTSFASPLIAGVIALFLEKWYSIRPGKRIGYQNLKEFLVITSVTPKEEFSHLGWAYGIIYPPTLFGLFLKDIDDVTSAFQKEMTKLIHKNIC